MKNKQKLTIIVKSENGNYRAWFRGYPNTVGEATELGDAVWFLIEKSNQIEIKEYTDIGEVRENLRFQLAAGLMEEAKDSANFLGRNITKREKQQCRKAAAREQRDLTDLWNKRRSEKVW